MRRWKEYSLKLTLAIALVGIALPAAAIGPQGKRLEIQYIDAAKLPIIDGDLSEWAGMSASYLDQSHFTSTYGEIIGPVPVSDQKVEVWLGWNEQTNLIYLAARVTDDDFGTTTSSDAGMVWASDDMEVYIDADNSGGAYNADNAQAQQYVLNPAGKQGLVLFPYGMSKPPKTQAAVKKSGNTYTYEMALPGWNAISESGSGRQSNFWNNKVIGLTIAFGDFKSAADADAADAMFHAFNGLNGPVGAYGDANQFTEFKLVGGPNVTSKPANPRGLTVSKTKAGGRGKPVAVESTSWGMIKNTAPGMEEEGEE